MPARARGPADSVHPALDHPAWLPTANDAWRVALALVAAGKAFIVWWSSLARMLIVGEQHLRLVLDEYFGHYNTRPHRTLQQSPPAHARMRVVRRDRLGGLIREYAPGRMS